MHLRRFDRTIAFERPAAEGPLGPALIDALARAVAAAHRRPPVRNGANATRVLRSVVRRTADELVAGTDMFRPKLVREFGAARVPAFDLAQQRLLRQGMQGQVRRCHGDLPLGNVAPIDGAPILFDALKADAALGTCDVL